MHLNVGVYNHWVNTPKDAFTFDVKDFNIKSPNTKLAQGGHSA